MSQENPFGEHPSHEYQYQVGGSLPLKAPSYVMRQADDELYHALQKGDFYYVLNSRQMGKSSLRVQTMHRLQTVGFRAGGIDMTMIGSQQITLDQWYTSVLQNLVSSFRLNVNLRTWWRERNYLTPVKRFSNFLEEVLLTEIEQNLVIFIDEIDSILGLNFRVDDFFALIRACYNERVEQPVYRRLTFTLLRVATPSDLIADKTHTPFNIGRSIELQGFRLQEAMPLLLGLKGKVDNPEAILRHILDWTGGQPFLTQKLCQSVLDVCQNRINPLVTIPSGQEGFWVAKLVRSRIINHWEVQDEPQHFKTIVSHLLSNQQQVERSLGLYQQILTSPSPVPTDESQEQIKLLLSGLVVKEQESLRVRNRIYEEVFNSEWVDKQLAKLRPYTTNLTAWLNSNRSDASRPLQGQALKDAKTWSQGKSLSDLDYQFLAASQELEQQEQQKALAVERADALAARLAQEQKTARLQRYLLSAVSLALVVMSGLGLVTFWQYRKAKTSEILAIARASEALFASHKRLDALIEAIRAWEHLQALGRTDADTESQVESALRQSAYGAVEYNRLSGHQDAVYGVTFSPDGQMIASASRDGTIKLWTPDGRLLQTLKGHHADVNFVTFSPDSQLLASASRDKTLKLWKQDGSLVRTLTGHSAEAIAVTFSSDGQMIASASQDSTVKLWKTDGTLLTTLTSHLDGVYGVAFSPDGQILASSSRDKQVILWDLQRVLDLDQLLRLSCAWVQNYLTANTEVKRDRHLCNQTP